MQQPPAFDYSEQTIAQSRRPRSKRHVAWEEIQQQAGGIYAVFVGDLARRYPALSPTELRISALIKGMLPSAEIARRLCIDEKTVENHRLHIRRKLGLNLKQNLQQHLAAS